MIQRSSTPRENLAIPTRTQSVASSGSKVSTTRTSSWMDNSSYNRTSFPCDCCKFDQKKCEQDRGIPCLRCSRIGRNCTVGGKTLSDNFNQLKDEVNCPLQIIQREDGLAAVYCPGDGYIHLQQLSPHYVKIGYPQCIGTQEHLAQINNNQGATLRDMLGRN